MKKLLLLPLAVLCLSGCAETGRLLGNVTMIPVRVVTGNMYTDADMANPDQLLLMEQDAMPMHAGN